MVVGLVWGTARSTAERSSRYHAVMGVCWAVVKVGSWEAAAAAQGVVTIVVGMVVLAGRSKAARERELRQPARRMLVTRAARVVSVEGGSVSGCSFQTPSHCASCVDQRYPKGSFRCSCCDAA